MSKQNIDFAWGEHEDALRRFVQACIWPSVDRDGMIAELIESGRYKPPPSVTIKTDSGGYSIDPPGGKIPESTWAADLGLSEKTEAAIVQLSRLAPIEPGCIPSVIRTSNRWLAALDVLLPVVDSHTRVELVKLSSECADWVRFGPIERDAVERNTSLVMRLLREWRRAEQKELLPATTSSLPDCRHSDDFASVVHYGDPYEFTKNQRPIVQILWEQCENGTAAVGSQFLLEEASSDQTRLSAVFRDHPAWSTMIVPGSRNDTYQIADPEKKLSCARNTPTARP